jgi:hypothetical protein
MGSAIVIVPGGDASVEEFFATTAKGLRVKAIGLRSSAPEGGTRARES